MDHQTVERLLTASQSNDANLRKAAATALGGVDDASNHVKSALLKLLKDKIWQVRESAIYSLGALKVVEAADAMKAILHAEDDAAARKAILTWANAKADIEAAGDKPAAGGTPLGGAPKKKPEGDPWQLKKAAALTLSKIRPDIAVQPLMGALQAPQAAAKQAAMVGLGNIQATEAVGALVDMMGDDDFNVRKMAATTLGKLKATEATDILIDALEDSKQAVRTEVVIALNHIKPEEALGALAKVVAHDSAYEVRKVAATALGNMKNPAAVEPLKAALKDDHWPVRKAAIDAMVNLRVVEVRDALIEYFADEEEEVAAAAAIGYIRLDLLASQGMGLK
jgi:HEAT repeat protein